MKGSTLGSSMTPVCLHPCSLSRSQLIAVCMGFLFPTRGGCWSMDTVLGLLDPRSVLGLVAGYLGVLDIGAKSM